jgi:hypothetical protein
MQEIELGQMKQEIEQLRFSRTALKQECEEWKKKHLNEMDDTSRLSGLSYTEGRHIKSIDRCSKLEVQLASSANEVTRLREHLSKAQKRVRQAELLTKASEDSSRKSLSEINGRSTTAELDSVRSQLIDLQQEHSKLKKDYVQCEETSRPAAEKTANAEQLQQAAEAEKEVYRHFEKANKVLQEQNLLVQKQILEATRESRINEAKVGELEKAIENHRADKMKAEDRVTELEAELKEWKLQPGDADATMEALEHSFSDSKPDTVASETSSSILTGELVSAASTVTATGLTANIIITINPTDQKNWTIFKRVQSAISRASHLDVTGPQDLVADFLAEMKRPEADHAEQTVAAAHWQQVALRSLTEVDSLSAQLQNRPVCGVPGHHGLADELEAKDLQLQLQATLVVQWQKKLEAARAFVEDANAEMRESGVQGV